MTTGNVVTTAFGRPSQVLGKCRNRLSRYLDARMEWFWQEVDDSLFRRAEQAGSSGEQTLFFDAMRQVRLGRESVERHFREQLASHFGDFLNGQYRYRAAALQESGEAELSLVDNDELERNLAVETMTRRARAEHEPALCAIRKRMESLTARRDLPEEVIPLDPGVIAESFRRALTTLDQPVAVELIVFKLFDRIVIGDLGTLYEEINALLVEQGLLPDLDLGGSAAARGNGDERGGNRDRAEEGDEYPEGGELFELLRQAVSRGVAEGAMSVSGTWAMPRFDEQGQSAGTPAAADGAAMGSGPWRVPPGAVVAATPDLLQALSTLQHQPVEAAGDGKLEGEALRHHIVEAVSRLKGTEVAGIDPVDQTLVDIVSTLFDFIYDDPAIPDRIKVLIGRLQIPVIKVAILDKGFFGRKNNPARRLLNTLARAGLGWVDDGSEMQRTLYARMEAVVDHILERFEDDVSVFQEELEAFEAWLEEEQQRAGRQEEQTARAEYNKEQLAVAKAVARQAIAQVLDDAVVPDEVRAFLEGTWRNLLVVLHLRHGSESEVWKKVLKVAVTLVWSLQPKTSAEERRRLAELLPALIRSLREGMRRMSCSQETEEALLQVLSREHARLMQDGEETMVDDVSAGEEEARTESAPGVRGNGDVPDDGGDLANGAPAVTGRTHDDGRSFMERKIEEINRLLESGHFSIEEEIVLGEAEEESLPEEDEFVVQAREMPEGTWLEVTEEGEVQRMKLSWRSLISGKIFFVNRQGLKVREMTVYGLAALLRSGKARILENVPVFDRAIGSLLSSVRGAVAGGQQGA